MLYCINLATSLSGSFYYSHQNQRQGQLTSTTYDAPRRLISGTYEMQLSNRPTEATLHCNGNVIETFNQPSRHRPTRLGASNLIVGFEAFFLSGRGLVPLSRVDFAPSRFLAV